MQCWLRGHMKGEAYEYHGKGVVVEVCIRCQRVVGEVAIDDWEFGDLLIEFLQEKAPR